MHREFRKLLKQATGRSEFIIAVNADIRGFSTFCKDIESTDVAMYIKRVYLKMIDEYFQRAIFFKSTGDGLMLAIPYSEDNLSEVVRETINVCLKLHVDFPAFCKDDQMIPYDVPTQIGIGIARGSACRLQTGTKIIDFSGRILNYATRLMDLARPSGIVFDGQFGLSLLEKTVASQFAADEVYVRSVAEDKPIAIHYLEESVVIHQRARQPIGETPWAKEVLEVTLRDMAISNLWRHALNATPSNPDEITIKLRHSAIHKGRKQKNKWTNRSTTQFKYDVDAGEPIVVLNYKAIRATLAEVGVKRDWPIVVTITYPAPPRGQGK